MTKITQTEGALKSAHYQDNITSSCNVYHFPTPHDPQANPLSRYAIPAGAALLYRSLAGKPPRCEALIAELIQIDALIEAKRGLVEPDILSGMEIAHDLILLQIRATSTSTDPDALLRRSILQGFAPRTGTFGLLPTLLSDERQLQKHRDAPCAAAPQERSQPLLTETDSSGHS
jgi:hypothetical protein